MENRNKIFILVLVVSVGFILIALTIGFSHTGNIILSDYGSTAYAPPYDVFKDNHSIFSLSQEDLVASNDFLNLSVNVSLNEGYIYKKGYIYNWQTDDWEIFNFVQTPVTNSYWIKDFASADLIVNASKTLQNGENYIVAYACKKVEVDDNWQCGCQTSGQADSGNCTRWMLQVFNVNSISNPAVPISCTSDADCASGNCSSGTGKCEAMILLENPETPVLSSDGWYNISTCTQLQNINQNLSANYRLVKDIDCSDTRDWNCENNICKGFKPIGDNTNFFIGNFNGSGYTISNLTINKPGVDCVGLFGSVTGNISNVGLNVVSVTGQNAVGGLVGNQRSGTISSSSATISGNVTASHYVGGLVGNQMSGTISSSSATISGNVTARSDLGGGWFVGLDVGGLVGYSCGTISNSSATISGSVTASTWNAGGLVGNQRSGTISSSSATISGSVSSAIFDDAGGLVGFQKGGTISDSSATISGNVTAGNRDAGGLVGRQTGGTISSSSATIQSGGSVTANSEAAGGLVGSSGGTISNSYATGSVSGRDYVGGLVGYSWEGTISNSYSTGSVSGNEKVGGLVGDQSDGTISNSYATGSVSGNWGVGGLVGTRENGNTINSYWDNQTSGQSTSAGGTGKTTAQMKTQSTFNGWDFTNVWNINEGMSYPYLRSSVPPMIDSNGNGYIEIYSCEQLQNISSNLSANYELGRDIDCSMTRGWNDGAGFEPLGDLSNPFSGKLDGNGYTISNLTIYQPGVNDVGLFGFVTGDISNVNLNVVSVTGRDYVGGLVGYSGGTISSSSATISGSVTASDSHAGGLVGESYGTISSSSATISGSVTAAYDVGGLVGWQNGGTISSSSATISGSVTATWTVGGLVGAQSDGTISNSSATVSGSVTASTWNAGGLVGDSGGTISNSSATIESGGSVTASNQYAGGLVGYHYGGTISSSSATISGNVTADSEAGGLVGHQSDGTISNSYATGSVSGNEGVGGLVGYYSDGTISNSYATGSVSGNKGVGGLVGYHSDGTISNSYWDKETSGRTTSAGGTGKTTAQMKNSGNYTGWDFISIWSINEGTSYPYLRWQN